MKNFKTIFYFEWVQLKRSSLKLWLLLMTVCSFYAIYYGNRSIDRQLKNIDYIEVLNDSTKQVFHNYFKDKKLADSLRFGWAGMNSLYDGMTTEDYLESNVAVNRPNRFSHLSVGQRDVNPLYRRVTARSLYYDGTGITLDDKYTETNNPHKLLAGNFDLSYVFIYLFPLLIIALCYNTFSQEKEHGTFPILSTQLLSMRKIITYKFLFRFTLVAAFVVIYSVLGYLFSPVKDIFPLSSFILWLVVITGYMLFWFAVSYCIVSLKYGSSVSALVLLGCWMLFLILVPALINNYIAANYKISSRLKFVTEAGQQIGSVWDINDSISLPMFYKAYPQHVTKPFEPLWTMDDTFDSLGMKEDLDLRYNKKIYLWHFILDANIKLHLAEYNKQIIDKLTAGDRFAWFNPAVTTQQALNDIAASGYRHNQQFRNETAAFRDSIFTRSVNFVFGEKKLTIEDYKGYPEFSLNNINIDALAMGRVLAQLLIASALFILIGSVKFKTSKSP